jgi:hypothetical protein
MSASEFQCSGMDAREVLSTIVAQGANLTLPREAVFYFYGAEGKLPALQSDLEHLGFAVRPTKTEPGRVAAMTAVVDEQWLRQMMPKLCAITNVHGVEYDGWEASIPEGHSKE